MDELAKKAVKKTILALRRLLEREDIPAVLRQYGIFPDGRRVPVEKLPLLDEGGRKRRERLEAIISREVQAVGGDQKRGVERYYREVAFTYLNRLVALRCMEVRGLIDECIRIRDEYAGRSLRHHRFLKENPGIQFDAEDTDSLKAFLRTVFRELQDDIKILFDPDDEYSIIMPTLNTLRECIRALNEDIPEGAFKEPELIGWVYQYFQTEEKNRVFEEVRTKKKKIEGDDIIPATSLYTERYMVDYLVQNSLGAIWMEMYPDSKLCEKWPYFVKDQDLKPREPRPVKSLTFLDPASGSGHFHLVAFDLLVQIYEEETRLAAEGQIPKEWVVSKDKIATTILESNLHGIDIDLRSVQLSYLVLYLRMREHQRSVGAPACAEASAGRPKLLPVKVNLVAADASLLNTPEFLSWCEEKFKEEPYAFNIVKGVAGRLHNLSEIGSLARPEEDLKEFIHREKERLLSAWKKEKAPRQEFLFREMMTPEQRELPFEKITDDQFWEGVLSRVTKALDDYYKDASERGDTRAQVLAHEASRGFKFLELCNKRYDTVATNPPYMASKNMGKDLKDYVQRVYPYGKRDLYAAFILRNREWTAKRGIIGMVTQQSWMFLRSFVEMREQLLKENCIRSLAHLGTHAFTETSGEVVNTVLFTLANEKLSKEDRIVAFRLIGPKSPGDKRRLLINSICKDAPGLVTQPFQHEFLEIQETPLVYWLRTKFFEILRTYPKLKEKADVLEGLHTGDNGRFCRYFWELPRQDEWPIYAKTGGFLRWFGGRQEVVNWKNSGEVIAKSGHAIIPSRERYFSTGLTFSDVARGSLSVRSLGADTIWSSVCHAVLTRNNGSHLILLATLNSRVVTYLLRAANPTLHFTKGYVENTPLPKSSSEFLSQLALVALSISKETRSGVLSEHEFKPDIQYGIIDIKTQDALLPLVTGLIDRLCVDQYGLSNEDWSVVIEETGTPAGWYPLIKGYDAIPQTDICEIPNEAIEHIKHHEHIKLSEEELLKIKSRLYTLYEAGPGAKVEDVANEEERKANSDEEEQAESIIGKRIPIPNETFLEEVSVKMEIHPVSIYWLLKEMREKEGLVCWAECKRYAEDYFTVMILRMLGFRWPKQIEANEPVPNWADKVGIIPITEHTEEKTLLERIRDRIGAEFGENKITDIESEFADIVYNAACKEAEIRGRTPPKKKVTLPNGLRRNFPSAIRASSKSDQLLGTSQAQMEHSKY